MVVKKLDMVFKTATGKEVTISIAAPKDDITKSEVNTVMNQIIAKNIFQSVHGKFAEISGAFIRTTDNTELV